MPQRSIKKYKAAGNKKIKTLLLTGLLTLCVGGAYADDASSDVFASGNSSNDQYKNMALGSAGAAAAAGVGLALLSGDPHTPPHTDPTTAMNISPHVPPFISPPKDPTHIPPFISPPKDPTHIPPFVSPHQQHGHILPLPPNAPSTPPPPLSRITIRGLKTVENPDGQIYVFQGHYYRVLNPKTQTASPMMALKTLFTEMESDVPVGKDLEVDNISNSWSDPNYLLVFANNGKTYKYDWKTLNQDHFDKPSITSTDGDSQIFGQDSKYITDYYVTDPQTISFVSPETQSTVFINRGLGINYSTDLSPNYKDKPVSDYFNNLFSNPCKFDKANTPCGITTVFSDSKTAYLFQKDLYVSYDFATGKGKEDSVTNFLAQYKVTSKEDKPQLDALFVDIPAKFVEMKGDAKNNTPLIDGDTDWHSDPHQDSKDEIFYLGDNGLTIEDAKDACFTLVNKTPRNFSKVTMELNPVSANDDLHEITVDKVKAFNTATYCINTTPALDLKNYSPTFALPTTGSYFNITLNGFWSYRGPKLDVDSYKYRNFYVSEKLQFIKALTEFKFLLNNQRAAARNQTTEVGSMPLDLFDGIINALKKGTGEMAPLMLRIISEDSMEDDFPGPDLPHFFSTPLENFGKTELQSDLTIQISNLLKQDWALTMIAGGMVQAQIQKDYDTKILDPKASLEEEIWE